MSLRNLRFAAFAVVLVLATSAWLFNASAVFARQATIGDGGTDISPLRCLDQSTGGQTGCYESYCDWYAPNKGITWNASWQCCYDDTHKLVKAQSYSCTFSFNNGCCTIVDTNPHCSSLTCQPTY